ncbi:MAG: transposase [Candidatus Marinimicrobia bacterium]|nr:transposase [Candidatus Neomarinimicrobiota bacterium]
MPNSKKCYKIIRQTRWPEGVNCLHCGSKDVIAGLLDSLELAFNNR